MPSAPAPAWPLPTPRARWCCSPNGGAASTPAPNPSPAMAKALLVNGAVDMGTPDIPNANEGWGRINITNVINPASPVEYWDQTQVLATTGQTFHLTLGVPNPGLPVKVTLAWTDAAGAVGRQPGPGQQPRPDGGGRRQHLPRQPLHRRVVGHRRHARHAQQRGERLHPAPRRQRRRHRGGHRHQRRRRAQQRRPHGPGLRPGLLQLRPDPGLHPRRRSRQPRRLRPGQRAPTR